MVCGSPSQMQAAFWSAPVCIFILDLGFGVRHALERTGREPAGRRQGKKHVGYPDFSRWSWLVVQSLMIHIHHETREALGTNHDLNEVRVLSLYYFMPLWIYSVTSLK